MADQLLERHLTVSEIAQALRVSEMTVRRWIAECLLPAVRTGTRSYRVPESGYRAFVADRTVKPAAAVAVTA